MAVLVRRTACYFPIAGRHPEAGQDETLLEVRDKLSDGPPWPSQLLPLCDWGCAIWSCLDCRAEGGHVITLAGEHGFFDSGRDLRSWLTAWLSGVDLWDEMFEPRTTMGINRSQAADGDQRTGARTRQEMAVARRPDVARAFLSPRALAGHLRPAPGRPRHVLVGVRGQGPCGRWILVGGRVARTVVESSLTEYDDRIDFDSERDMFCARSKDRTALVKLAEVLLEATRSPRAAGPDRAGPAQPLGRLIVPRPPSLAAPVAGGSHRLLSELRRVFPGRLTSDVGTQMPDPRDPQWGGPIPGADVPSWVVIVLVAGVTVVLAGTAFVFLR